MGFAYKAFAPGLKCRDYQYKMGLNVFDEANCVKNGAHCCEEPFNCLDYYSSFEDNEFYLVYADGEVHEDGSDTKIACTHLEIISRLTIYDFVSEELNYIARHYPQRSFHRLVKLDKASAEDKHFAIAIGKFPLCRGKQIGDVLGFASSFTGEEIERLGIIVIDGDRFKPNVWYNIDGREIEDDE
jgi:hypothetical protein